MEGQQRSDQNNVYLKIDEQQLEMKYNQFYAELQIVQSEPASSDFDNLELKLNQRIHENHYDIYCQIESDLDHIRRNPRVADIPTVYLGTCIKTQYLPVRRSSILDECDQQNKNNKRMAKDINSKQQDQAAGSRQDQSKGGQKIDFNESIDKVQREGQHYIQKQKVSHKISFLCKDKNRNNKIKIFPNQSKWKTDYITIKKEQFLNVQTKQRKIMHQQWRFSKISQKNDIKESKNEQVRGHDHDPQLYQRIIQILKSNQNLCMYANNGTFGMANQINIDNNKKSMSLKSLKVYKLQQNGVIKQMNSNKEQIQSSSCKYSIDSRKRKRNRQVSKYNSGEEGLQYGHKQKYKYPCRNHVLEDEMNHYQNKYKQQFPHFQKKNLSQVQNIKDSLKQAQMLE